jgi:hypothetical protein
MKFINQLRELLEHIQINPEGIKYYSLEIPLDLVNEIKTRAVEAYRQYPKEFKEYSEIEDFDGSRLPNELSSFYESLIKTGIKDKERIRRIVLYVFYEEVIFIPSNIELESSDEFYLDLAVRHCFEIFEKNQYELLTYSLNNYLCNLNNNRIKISNLGNAFLRLPDLQAMRFLLSLEVFLNSGRYDRLHISRSFLSSLISADSITQYKRDFVYSAYDEYVHKLLLFGLANNSVQDGNELLKLTSLGQTYVESVLSQDSIFDVLIPFYVSEELAGTIHSRYLTGADLERLNKILKSSSIVGEHKEAILLEIKRFAEIESENAYFSIFTALAPRIEGIVKNIIEVERIQVKKNGLYNLTKALSKPSKSIIKKSTEELINAVFKEFRNISSHGGTISSEPARMLCEITLVIIEEIHKDYYRYKKDEL